MRIRSSVSIVVSITLVMIGLGSIGLILLGGQRLSNYIKEHILVSVVLDENISQQQTIDLQMSLNAQPFVKSSEYVTQEEAQRRLEKELGVEFSKILDYNPLKSSIDLKLHGNYIATDSIAQIEKKLLKKEGVAEVFYKKGMMQTINKNLEKITIIILVISVLLLLISFTLINNTIRMSIYAKRNIISTMQIVGATGRFVRRPFLRSGVARGFLAGVITVIVIVVGVYLLPEDFKHLILLEDPRFWMLLGALLFLSIFFSWFATFFAVSRYLRKHPKALY